MSLIYSIISLVLLILQLFYIRYWIKRRKKYNNSGSVEMTDTSSIVKIAAVTIMLFMTTAYFFLKFLDEN